MNRPVRFLTVLCLLLAAGTSHEILAICQTEGPYPVQQCATLAGGAAWFAPKPLDAGTIKASWWILGMGNLSVVDPSSGLDTTGNDGDGFLDTPNPGVFIGNDSGALTVGFADGQPMGGLDLVDADFGSGGATGSAGGLCFSVASSWGLPYLDGCGDANRTYYYLGAGGNLSDNFIDVYFAGSPGTASDQRLVDPPMGTLLTESSNKYFAVAFFSSTPRNGDPNDFFDKGYDMGEIINGDDNPSDPNGNDNIVPWQLIPQPRVIGVLDPNSTDRILSVQWSSIRVIHDNSSRPNLSAGADTIAMRWTLGMDPNGTNVTGVGVLEQPDLASYIVERKPIVGVDCDANAPWAPEGPAIVPPFSLPGGSPLATSVSVPRDTCVRLTTHLGRIPSVAFRTTPVSAATRNQNRFDAQAGNLGDIGFEVSSAPIKIGGVLLSDRPVLRSVTPAQRSIVVRFETLGEIELERFDVMARDRRGSAVVVATVDCAECISGIGAEYVVEVPRSALRAARSIYVVSQPNGTSSNEMEIGRAPARPQSPGRGTAGAGR